MVGFLTSNEEAEQYLVAAVLRRGNATGSLGALGILRRLIPTTFESFNPAGTPALEMRFFPGARLLRQVGSAVRQPQSLPTGSHRN
jgi:hypothetical protein